MIIILTFSVWFCKIPQNKAEFPATRPNYIVVSISLALFLTIACCKKGEYKADVSVFL